MNNSKFAVLAGSLLAAGCAFAGTVAHPSVPAIANTAYITAPQLVSAGMANILAFVPAQPGATYLWSVTGGTIPGVTRNAAVYFNAGAAGTATLQCEVTLSGVQTTYTPTSRWRPRSR